MDCKCLTQLLLMCDVYVILSGQVSYFYVPERLFCLIIQLLLAVFLHVLLFFLLLDSFIFPLCPSYPLSCQLYRRFPLVQFVHFGVFLQTI